MQLTHREIEVLARLADGLQTREIASLLFVSKHTISKHRKNICQKLNIHSTAKLIAYAVALTRNADSRSCEDADHSQAALNSEGTRERLP